MINLFTPKIKPYIMACRKFINAILLIIPLILVWVTTNAQNLPAKQKGSLRAPAGIKIDGKATEWDNKLQAYNKATGIFYTMANDDDKLYLTVQATDQLIIRKIMNGGLTLKINAGREKDSGVLITYPVFDKNDRPIINLKNKPSDNKGMDSLITLVNKRFAEKSKEIKIKGIKSIADTLISVYNQDDIKAAALFDHDAAYTYELAIPLKSIGISATSTSKFNYTITLSGAPLIDGSNIIPATATHRAVLNVYVGAGAAGSLAKGDMAILSNPTNFDGEYTLAAK